MRPGKARKRPQQGRARMYAILKNGSTILSRKQKRMRVLIIGSGAREHALAWAISRSPEVSALYCAPGNGGTAAIAQNIPLSVMDFDQCAEWAATHAIDLTIIGPDDGKVDGMCGSPLGA